ncbi:MAG: thioredoxin family protein [Atribacterota bacterium]
MKVQVFGVGCKKCNQLYEMLKKYMEKNHIDAELEHIEDLDKLLEAGIMMSPAVFIDGVKKSEGRIPTETQIKEWFSLK